jgi:hypothetical protein
MGLLEFAVSCCALLVIQQVLGEEPTAYYDKRELLAAGSVRKRAKSVGEDRIDYTFSHCDVAGVNLALCQQETEGNRPNVEEDQFELCMPTLILGTR